MFLQQPRIWLLVWVFLLPCYFLFSREVLAQGDFSEETIKSFDVQAEILESGSVNMKERIVYDFGENARHGIYRDIATEGVRLKVQKVLDDEGEVWSYQTPSKRGYLQIKIGNPTIFIKGLQTYNIFYQAKSTLGYFDTHDEFYWDVTGNEWLVPIESASITVRLPKAIPERHLRLTCYTGSYGSKSQECFSWLLDERTIRFEAEKPLGAGEGLTVVVGWPKGIVAGPSLTEKLLDFLWQWGFLLLPVIAFFFLISYWWKRGRDAKVRKTIIAQYEPPHKLKPAEVSIILSQRTTPRAISATMIDLAVKGYLKIKEKEEGKVFKKKDWQLIKLKDFAYDSTLGDYERLLLSDIFEETDEVAVSSLQGKLQGTFDSIKRRIAQEMTKAFYFTQRPDRARRKFLVPAVLFLIASGGFFFWAPGSWQVWPSFALSALLFLLFSAVMPQRTERGAEALWHILGFKEYIKTAEKYRVEFQEKENLFEKFLPYAMVFELANKWAKAFEGIYTKQPSWYESSAVGAFSTVAFVSSLNSSIAGFATSLSPKGGGRSSGSGFSGGSSGGGAGGGGGGSW